MPLLMAKIKKRRALANPDSIADAADCVMVARRDLGVETDICEIPVVQKRIIAAASARGRLVVTATQMLESMVEHERSTRAEVTDVANAALDGTDAVVLSAESAIGRRPASAVRILQGVFAVTEAEYAARMAAENLQTAPSAGPDQAAAFAACQLAERLDAKAIITHVTIERSLNR
jgi:pyruvate kinase